MASRKTVMEVHTAVAEAASRASSRFHALRRSSRLVLRHRPAPAADRPGWCLPPAGTATAHREARRGQGRKSATQTVRRTGRPGSRGEAEGGGGAARDAARNWRARASQAAGRARRCVRDSPSAKCVGRAMLLGAAAVDAPARGRRWLRHNMTPPGAGEAGGEDNARGGGSCGASRVSLARKAT